VALGMVNGLRFIKELHMKIIAYNGSPHTNGHCGKLIKKMLKGAASKGAETKRIDIIKQDIQHCNGCFKCATKDPELKIGKCTIDDDMHEILEEWDTYDGYILACPVYDMGITSIMKKFVERRIALTYRPKDAHVTLPEARNPYDFRKKAALIVTGFCGDELVEVMGEPCFVAMDAHLIIEQIETIEKLYVGGIETLTKEDWTAREQTAFDVGVRLVEEIIAEAEREDD
jgi:NAD(P)H-dependent FMN reductase